MEARFDIPLFRPSEVERFLRLPRSKVRTWIDATTVSRLPEDAFGLTIPYAGLLEAQVVHQLRQAGLALAAIREANDALKRELDRPHPLIWRHLAHDGKDILRPFEAGWVRARDGQRGIPDVIDLSLQRVVAWQGDYPSRIRLDGYGGLDVMSDPEYSGGHPIHWESGVRVEDIVGLVRAGDGLDVAAEEFRIPRAEVEELVLAEFRLAA